MLYEIQRALPVTRKRVTLLLPFSKSSVAARLRQEGIVHSEEYTENGILIDTTAEISYLDTLKDYIM